MDATWNVGVEQIKWRYLTARLLGLGVREVVPVPAFPCIVILIKKMNFLAGRQINVWVLPQRMMQCCGATFLGAESEELR